MRKSLFTIIVLATLGQLHAQQIPNAGFETWTDFNVCEDPESWMSLNMMIAFGGPETGLYFCKSTASGGRTQLQKLVKL